MADQPSIWCTPPGQKPTGDLVDQLTEYGREQMLREIGLAIGEATAAMLARVPPPATTVTLRNWIREASGDSRVQRVVESYRRTALVRQDPDYGKPETERPLWDVRRGETDCPCDFIEWDAEAKFRSGVDGQLKMAGWCPTCWQGSFVTLGEPADG